MKPNEGEIPSSLGTLTVDDVAFPVEEATFTTDGRTLDFDVRSGHPDIPLEEPWWGLNPRIYAEAAPIPIDADAPRAGFEVGSPASSPGEWLLCLYMHEHEWVTRCRGTFVRDADGHRFEATGEAEVMGASVRFAVTTRILRVARS